MPWVRLTFDLVTPCFLAGAAGKESTPEEMQSEGLRPPSLIGSWRYWLRAALGSDPHSGWREREADLFGCQHRGGRQGRVAVRARRGALQVVPRGASLKTLAAGGDYADLMFKEGENPIDPLGYLLGQGLFSFREGLTRPAFKAGQQVEMDLTIRKRSGADSVADWGDLRQALWLWQTFGGLGARSRRGWGSVQIASVDGLEAIPVEERTLWKEWFAGARSWNRNSRNQDAQRFLEINRGQGTHDRELAFTGAGTNPDELESARSVAGNSTFPHVGAACAVLRVPEGDQKAGHWARALAELGKIMLNLRSNVHGRSRPTNELRVSDHDAVRDLLFNNRKPKIAPSRCAFGLPHGVQFSGASRSKTELKGTQKNATRRASPVLLHVARHLDEKQQPLFLPVVLWFKANLLPPGEQIVDSRTQTRMQPPDWSAVVAFLQAYYA